VTIAAINGPCAGGAAALACAVDLRVAARSGSFTTAFARVGQTGDMALAWTLTRLLGGAKARELMLLSETVPAAEAQRIGLVSHVFDDETFMDEVRALANRAASLAPLAMLGMKENLRDSMVLDLDEYLDQETTRYVSNSSTLDSVEAANAFLERRQPQYLGR
jgi:2-(1,2-epoxy-1,2-dihydrophenyl)acetyl-CoA isomerase